MSTGHVLVALDDTVPLVRTRSSADGLYLEKPLAFPPIVKMWKGSERPALTVVLICGLFHFSVGIYGQRAEGIFF